MRGEPPGQPHDPPPPPQGPPEEETLPQRLELPDAARASDEGETVLERLQIPPSDGGRISDTDPVTARQGEFELPLAHDQTEIESSILRLPPELKRRAAPPPDPESRSRVGALLGGVLLLTVLGGLSGSLWSKRQEQLATQRERFFALAEEEPAAALAAAEALPAALRERVDVQARLDELREELAARARFDEARRLLGGRAQDPDLEARVRRCERALALDPSWGEARAALVEARWARLRQAGESLAAAAPSLLNELGAGGGAREPAGSAAISLTRGLLRQALDPRGPDGRRARADFAEAANLDPEGGLGALAEGARQLQLGRPLAAARALERALERRGDLWRAHLLLGRARLARGQRAAAAATAERACALDPLAAEAWQLQACALAPSAPAEAAAALLRATALAPRAAWLELARAELAWAAGEPEAAAIAAREALRRDPGLWAAHALLAERAARDERPRVAEEHLRRSLASSRSARALGLRARLRLKQGELQAAAGDLALSLELDPSDLESAELLAETWLRLRQPEAARPLIERLVAEAPGRVDPLRLQAFFHAHAGRWSEALESLSEALALEPADARLRLERGIALLELGRSEQAALDLAALQPGPRLPTGTLAYWRGRLAEARGQRAAAREGYRACLSDPAARRLHGAASARLDSLR